MSLLKLRKFVSSNTARRFSRKKFNLVEGDFLEAEAVEKGILLKPVTVVEREKPGIKFFNLWKTSRIANRNQSRALKKGRRNCQNGEGF